MLRTATLDPATGIPSGLMPSALGVKGARTQSHEKRSEMWEDDGTRQGRS